MCHQIEVSDVYQIDTGSNSVSDSAGSDATQQKLQGTPILGATYEVSPDHCGGVGPPRVMKGEMSRVYQAQTDHNLACEVRVKAFLWSGV